jgi:type II secretory pathway pseudopilin PulG
LTNHRTARNGDAGDTLIEILVALMIMGVVFLAVLAGMATVITGAASNRSGATEEALLRSYAEVLISPPGGSSETGVAYQACSNSVVPTYTVPSSLVSVPSGFTAYVSKVQVWNGSSYDPPGWSTTYTFTSGGSPPSATTCTDYGLQNITITASTTSGKSVTETLTVLKESAL